MGLLFDSWSSDLIFTIISLALGLIYIVKKKHSYFKERNIPHVKPRWLIGTGHKVLLMKETFEKALHDVYLELKEHGWGGYYQLLRPMYLICDPEMVEKILIKDFSYFHDHGFKVDETVSPLDGHLFNMSGDKWRVLRNKLSPTFTSGKLKWMFPQIKDCADSMTKFLEGEANGEDYAVRDICSRYGLDVIGSCAFGIDVDAINKPDSEFRKMSQLVFNPTKKVLWKSMIRFLFPSLFMKLKMKTIDERVEKFFFDITKNAFEHRLATGENRNDFVQLLLQLREKGSVDIDPKDKEETENWSLEFKDGGKIDFTDELLAAQSFIFFAAGFEPSATLMAYTLYLFSKYEEIQKKVREEIRQQKEKHGDLTYDALKECTYFDNCMSEALRLYAPNFVLFRVCNKTYNTGNGVIEKGSTVLIPTHSIHMDPDYYPEPEKFNPSRFEGSEKPRPGVYIPFGEGPRVCIAKRFASLQSKLGLAAILDKFEILPSDKNIEPLQRDPKSFIIQPIGGLWVRLKKAE